MKSRQIGITLTIILSVFASGCFLFSETLNPTPEATVKEIPEEKAPTAPGGKCGDGVCDQLEREKGVCPQDCPTETQDDLLGEIEIEYESIGEFEYYVTNPSSGSKLYVRIYPSPVSGNDIPTVIFIPGGIGDSSMFTDQLPGGSVVERFSGVGLISVVFDPEGRGRSEGIENNNGFVGQDGLYAITKFVQGLPNVGDIGYISQSYGSTLGTGVLARYKHGPAIFLIDWEGPANRFDTTVGCRSDVMEDADQTGPMDRSCADDEYWIEREAETFAQEIEVPYHRLQSLKDHVQPDASNAIDMIKAATHTMFGGNGKSPWTRLNDFEPNTIFSAEVEDELTENDQEKYYHMIVSAKELFAAYGSGGSETVDPGRDQGGQGTVYLGLMVHLEGWVDEVENEVLFDKHMSAAKELADVFEIYGAKVTFEASPKTIEACGVWENVLLELELRGHGIGVHADRGYSKNPNYNLRKFTTEIAEMKRNAEALGLTIQHVSGICSELDWAKASIDAGYQFTTGGVGFCAMSMPEEIRPEEYKDCPSPSECHGNMPVEMTDRIHPWRINTALGDWTVPDPSGKLVILSSDGGIKNLYEGSLDPDATHGDMEYTDEDIDILLNKVEEAIQLADPNQVNILYFSLSIGAADVDVPFYEEMFAALQPYVDAGLLEYKTMNEMYQEYITTN